MIRQTTILFLCGLVLWGCASAPGGGRQAVHHVVLVWLPEPVGAEGRDALIEATRGLGVIPGVSDLRVGTAVPSERGIVDDSFDVGIVMTFDSVETMNRYLVHPQHLDFVERHVRGRVDRLVVYDVREAR